MRAELGERQIVEKVSHAMFLIYCRSPQRRGGWVGGGDDAFVLSSQCSWLPLHEPLQLLQRQNKAAGCVASGPSVWVQILERTNLINTDFKMLNFYLYPQSTILKMCSVFMQ